MSVNKVILVGRLGRDPETRYTGGGQAVANFSVATDETYKDRNGERQKRTEWHKIVVWGKQAEIAQQYLKKGSLIFIEGRIQSREWQDKEGQKRTSFEIVANNFRMLGGRAEGAAAGAAAQARPAVVPTISIIKRLPRKTPTVAVAAVVTHQPAQKSPTKTFPSNHRVQRLREYIGRALDPASTSNDRRQPPVPSRSSPQWIAGARRPAARAGRAFERQRRPSPRSRALPLDGPHHAHVDGRRPRVHASSRHRRRDALLRPGRSHRIPPSQLPKRRQDRGPHGSPGLRADRRHRETSVPENSSGSVCF